MENQIQNLLADPALLMTNDIRDYLLTIHSDTEDFTTRGIDRYIHMGNPYPLFDFYRHLDHQKDIINLVRRGHLELEVFNDERVRYPDNRPELSGTTGTMSNVLTSYFFTLYDAMLRVPGMVVNPVYDLQQCHHLACLFNFDTDTGAVILPGPEFESFCNIVRTLKTRTESPLVFFTEAQLDTFRAKCAAAAVVVSGYRFADFPGRFISASVPPSYNLVQKGPVSFGWCIRNPAKDPSFAALQGDPITTFLSHLDGENGRYGPYAYNPCYIHQDDQVSLRLNGFSRTSLDGIVAHMERVYGLLTTLEAYPQQEPIRCLKPMDRFENVMGGKRTRRNRKRTHRRKGSESRSKRRSRSSQA